jgi:epoxyqueuosine reductase
MSDPKMSDPKMSDPTTTPPLEDPIPLKAQIQQQAIAQGFHAIGIVRLADWLSAPATGLQNWLHQGHQASMDWMANPRRQDIATVMPEARSMICLALNYYTPQARPDGDEYAKISRYGWGRDYHKVITKKLKALSAWLEAQDATIKTRYYVDTGPVQDKLWAERSGIGWIAKNSNVITRKYGSWVFLSEILTNLDLAPDQPHTQHCGTCSKCIDSCPTDAIVQPFVVDANRCIAYHTIENREPTLPEAVALHGWVAGCDICQDVCPWNQRFAQETDVADFQPYPDNVAPKLAELATIDQTEYDRRFPASALRRIRPDMMRRNAQASIKSQSDPVID